MQLAAGTQLDRYVVVHPLGQGGMAHVVLVRHQRLGTLHALKILHGGSPRLRARLLREGQVQGNLRHTNVLSVTDVVDVDGMPGLVMEYVDGPDLARLLEAHRLTPEEADALARPILDGVVAAHRAGLVHRDLKPANVLVAVEDERLVPKVADFGLAKVLDDDPNAHKTRSGVAMGTPAYMAPEQVRDASKVDARADVFALGCILYELVSGRTTFRASDSFELLRKVVDGEFEDVRSVAPGLDEAMVDAIHGALRADPDERIPSAEALRAAWIGDRPDPRPDWDSLVSRARALGKQPAPEGTWSGGADQTWSGSMAVEEPAPTVAPTVAPAYSEPAPSTAAPGMGRASLALGAVIGALLVGAALVLGRPVLAPQTPDETTEARVLTSTAAIPVVDDPVLQGQFDEGWQAFLDADFRTAERKLEQVVPADPPDPLFWFLLAQTRLAQDDISQGIEAIWTGVTRAKTWDSDFARLIPHMARTAIAEGWESEHGEAVIAYVESHPDDYFMRVLGLYDKASIPTPEPIARRFFESAVALDPQPAAAYALHASGRLRDGAWEEAMEVADRGLVRNPGNPALLARKGAAHMHLGDFDSARASLLEATRADPGLTQARIDLGLAALAAGDEALFEEVDRAFSGTTLPIEQRATWTIGLAWSLLGEGRPEEAIARLAALETEAREADLWALAFELAGQQGNIHKLFWDVDAFAATLERLKEATTAPELSAENRQRLTEIAMLNEAWLAAARHDLDALQRLRKRLASIPNANPNNVAVVDHYQAIAERRHEDLQAEAYESDSCRHVLMAALDRVRAGGDPAQGLPPVEELGCSAVSADPFLLQLVQEAIGAE